VTGFHPERVAIHVADATPKRRDPDKELRHPLVVIFLLIAVTGTLYLLAT
jgi:hypothetical protein